MRRARAFAGHHPWALSCDIQRYFPTVSHTALLGTIARVIADERVRLRDKSLKNFRRRYRRLLAGVQRGHVKLAAPLAGPRVRDYSDRPCGRIMKCAASSPTRPASLDGAIWH